MTINRTQVAAALVATCFVILGLVLFDHTPPFRFVAGSVTPQRVAPGQMIEVSLTLDWRRRCELDVTRVLRDGAGEEHKLPWSKSSPPPALGEITSRRQVVVPTTAKFGAAACYRATIYMTCGVLDRVFPIRIDVPCVNFEIVPP